LIRPGKNNDLPGRVCGITMWNKPFYYAILQSASPPPQALIRWVMQAPRSKPKVADNDIEAVLHPQESIEREASKWGKLWNPAKEDLPEWKEVLLFTEWTKHLRQDLETPWLEGSELRRIINANTGKAAGTDEWAPAQWALLPDGFFNALAALWNLILHGDAPLPEAWLQVRVILIPKEGGWRPLSIATIAWRIGLAAILKRTTFRSWIQSWLTEEVAGGVPGAAAADIHSILKEGIFECTQEEMNFAGAKVDLQKCFDKASAHIGVEILQQLGLPSTLGRTILQFYASMLKGMVW